jgi:hypothetical protein
LQREREKLEENSKWLKNESITRRKEEANAQLSSG